METTVYPDTMELTHPSEELRARWETDWQNRAGYIPAPRRGDFASFTPYAMSLEGTEHGVVAVGMGTSAAGTTASIADIWIQPSSRQAGYARMGLRQTEALCLKQHAIHIGATIHSYNPAAQALFADYETTSRHLVRPVDSQPQLAADIAVARMSEDEYLGWVNDAIDTFAQQLSQANDVPLDRAMISARNIFQMSLPRGTKTENNELWTLRVDKQQVAQLWIRRNMNPAEIYVQSVAVNKAHRRQGYGRAAMLLAERRAVIHGLSRVRLNVFDHNVAANELYRNLGYELFLEYRFKHRKH